MVKDFDHKVVEFFGGILNRESAEKFENLLAADEELDRQFAQDCELWLAASAALESQSFSAERAFKRFNKSRKQPRKTVSPVWRYAFSFVIAVLISIFSFNAGKDIVENGFVENVTENPVGTSSRIVLPDGTSVWINGGSSLTYSQGFGIRDRNVKLDGEAYFEVTKDENLPFVVNTDNLQVRVLGTKFNCRDYKEDSKASVTLVEGRVQMTNTMSEGSSPIFLAPNECCVLDKNTGLTELTSQNASNAMMWTDGILFFDEVTLEDMVKDLERCYGIDLVFADDSLRSMRVYGNFNIRKQSIEDVLETLSATNNLKYLKQENTLHYIITN